MSDKNEVATENEEKIAEMSGYCYYFSGTSDDSIEDTDLFIEFKSIEKSLSDLIYEELFTDSLYNLMDRSFILTGAKIIAVATFTSDDLKYDVFSEPEFNECCFDRDLMADEAFEQFLYVNEDRFTDSSIIVTDEKFNEDVHRANNHQDVNKAIVKWAERNKKVLLKNRYVEADYSNAEHFSIEEAILIGFIPSRYYGYNDDKLNNSSYFYTIESPSYGLGVGDMILWP